MITMSSTINLYSKEQIDAKLTAYQTALSQGQLDAVNSGITSALVTQIGTNQTAIATINASAVMNSGITSGKVSTYDGYATTIAGKQDAISIVLTDNSYYTMTY